jgi:hypothetical protein
MQVLNRHHLNGIYPTGAIYVGRGTPLGNPFAIGEETKSTRDEVVAAYTTWLDRKISDLDPVFLTSFAGLRADSILVCSCSPLPCHARAIANAWERLQGSGGVCPKRPVGTLTYAGIGSRTTPPEILRRMSKIANRLEERGYTLRSGGANGADTAFDEGCSRKQIFLPWTGFNDRRSSFHSISEGALGVAAAVHPAFNKLSPAAKKLMARNTYQVLGDDIRSPSDFIVCWTPDGAENESQRSRSTGGTGQAIALANRWNIPIFNLARPDALDRLAGELRNATV